MVLIKFVVENKKFKYECVPTKSNNPMKTAV
jgi:hypothetical protein